MSKKLAGVVGLAAAAVAVVAAAVAVLLEDLRSLFLAVSLAFLATACALIGAVALASVRHLIWRGESDRRYLDAVAKNVSEMKNDSAAFGAAVMEGLAAIEVRTQATMKEGLAAVEIGMQGKVEASADKLQATIRGLDESVARRIESTGNELRSATQSAGTRIIDQIHKEALTEFSQYESYQALMRFLDLDLALAGTRGWAISPDAALALVRSIVDTRPDHVLEAGSGVSTVIIAAALERLQNGRLISLEHEDQFARQTLSRVELAGLSHRCQVVVAPLVEHVLDDGRTLLWYETGQIDVGLQFQLVLADGPPQDSAEDARYPLLPLMEGHLVEGCKIFLDDADREPEKRALDSWITEYPGSSVTSLRTEKGLAVFTLRRRTDEKDSGSL